MLKLADLIRLTPRPIITRSRQASVRVVTARMDVDEIGEHKKVLCSIKADDGPRDGVFKFYDHGSKNLATSRIWLHCSCPFFLYYLEVALTARKSSSVINSNGAYPRMRNPQLRPYLCKHLFAAAKPAIKARAKKMVLPGAIDDQEIQRMMKFIQDIIPK
jgi:hypothetical protein